LEIQWLDRRSILLLHGESLAQHGGLPGIGDAGLLDSALARPMHLLTYNADATLAELAAAYCFGISRNHPFMDGNKRAAFAVFGLFLPDNGWWLQVSQEEAFRTMMSLAAGELTEEQLAAWVGQHLIPLELER
jgi:death-on-curing protein